MTLLEKREIKVKRYSKTELEEISRQVEDVLQDYGIAVEVEAVHRERERRKSRPASTPGPQPAPASVAVSVEDLLAYAERITARALDAAMADRRAADAARDQAEDLLRASLAEATQRAEAAEAEAQELRERLASKPWKRKGKGKGKRKG